MHVRDTGYELVHEALDLRSRQLAPESVQVPSVAVL